MGKSVRSARGALVNFDLLKIKQQMATAPKPKTVEARENFIDQKFKRRVKKLTRPQVATSIVEATPEEPEDFDLPEDDETEVTEPSEE